MTLLAILLNLLFAFLAFFIVRYVASLVVPEGKDKEKIINIVAIIIAIVVFFLNLATSLVHPV